VFLTAGIPKLFGAQPPALQAAAMHGFPAWLRVLVGLAEVAGGLSLLIPRFAVYGALGLALLMVPATITQAMSGEPGLFVPIGLCALLVLLAWLRDEQVLRNLAGAFAPRPGPVLRQGVVAGILGATAVALWFFVIDILAGHPLFTPRVLGDAIFTLFGGTRDLHMAPVVSVFGYTLIHYAAFIAVGIAVADLVAWSGREPALLLGFVILLAVFEVGFYGLVMILRHSGELGELLWPQVMMGNIIAAASMGGFMWRAHPQLRDRLAHAFD
jgi:hypothetical protein